MTNSLLGNRLNAIDNATEMHIRGRLKYASMLLSNVRSDLEELDQISLRHEVSSGQNFKSMWFKKGVKFSRLIEDSVTFSNCVFEADNVALLDLRFSKVNGEVTFRNCVFKLPENEKGFWADHSEIDGALRFEKCFFLTSHDIPKFNITIGSEHAPISLASAKSGGVIILDSYVGGTANFSNMEVLGSFIIGGTIICGPDQGHAIRAQAIRVKGNFWLGCEAESLALPLGGSEQARAKGNVLLGGLWALQCRIDSSLVLDGVCMVSCDSREALNLQNSKIENELRIIPLHFALSGVNSNVKSMKSEIAFFPTFYGAIFCSGTEINGHVQIKGPIIRNLKKTIKSVEAGNCTFNGKFELFCDFSDEIQFSGCDFNSNVYLDIDKFRAHSLGKRQPRLDFSGSHFRRTLAVRGNTEIKDQYDADLQIDLSGCRVESLSDDSGRSWLDYSTNLDRISVGAISGIKAFSRSDVDDRMRWLERYAGSPPDARRHSPQPYAEFARLFDRAGNYYGANHVRQRKIRRDHLASRPVREGKTSEYRGRYLQSWLSYRAKSLGLFIADLFFGFGLAPLKALIWCVLFLAAGSLLYWQLNATANMLIETTASQAFVTNEDGATAKLGFLTTETSEISTEALCGNAIQPAFYAVDTFIPLVELGDQKRCIPTQKFRWINSLYALLGWIMISGTAYTVSKTIFGSRDDVSV